MSHGLPKTTATRGRATCPLGHSWNAIRVSGWRWSTEGGRVSRDPVRRPVEKITYAPEDCPTCGQAPTTFRGDRR